MMDWDMLVTIVGQLCEQNQKQSTSVDSTKFYNNFNK